MDWHAHGRSRFRWALVIGTFGPCVEYQRLVYGPPSLFYGVEVAIAAFSLAASFTALWLFGFPLLHLTAWLGHKVAGRKIDEQVWIAATFHALWPLPYAAALGVLLWLFYSVVFHERGDVIFGTLGNLLGAWCYGTILVTWWRLLRGALFSTNATQLPATDKG